MSDTTNTPIAPPIPMLLWCPECHVRHIDIGEFATKVHQTHACQTCGHVWRPAIVATVGVQFLPGFKNPEQFLLSTLHLCDGDFDVGQHRLSRSACGVFMSEAYSDNIMNEAAKNKHIYTKDIRLFVSAPGYTMCTYCFAIQQITAAKDSLKRADKLFQSGDLENHG
jgi:hypothetical protein